MSAPNTEREAEVLLSIDDAIISEIHGADRVIVAKHVEAMIVSITPTEAELGNATQQLGLAPGTLQADGRPLVFILAGDYKIPVCPNVPAIQETPKQFIFTVPNLWMVVTLPDDCDEETSEAFGMLIKTYGKMQANGGTSTANFAAPADTSNSSSKQPAGYPGSPGYPLAVAGGGHPVPAGYPSDSFVKTEGSRDVGYEQPSGYPSGTVAGGAGYSSGTYGGQQPEGYPGASAGYPAGAVALKGEDGRPISTKVAGAVAFLSRNLIKGIHKGRDVAVGGIGAGSGKIIEKTTACEKPVHVPVEYQAKMAKARATTKSAVVLTGAVTSALVGVSAVLGSGAAGLAGKAIPGGVASRALGGEKNKYVEGVKEVGGAVVGGAACVFVEATDAARAVLTAGTAGVTDVVGHKYGAEVGGITGDGLGVVTDGVTAASNVRNIGVKAVAKNAAKHAGKQLYGDLDAQYGDQSRHNRIEAPQQQQQAYPSPPPPAQAYPSQQ